MKFLELLGFRPRPKREKPRQPRCARCKVELLYAIEHHYGLCRDCLDVRDLTSRKEAHGP